MKKYQSLQKALEHALKPLFEKYDVLEYQLISNWQHIVGYRISSICQPISVKFYNHRNIDGLLLLALNNLGFSLEVQSSESIIIKKIHDYFGYRVIGKIKTTVK